jgi:hypothetical protein
VDLHHLPGGTHSLAPRPGSLVRLAFQKWPAEPKFGERSSACHAVASCEGWSAWQDSHLQPSRFERDASAGWATRGWPAAPKLGAKAGAHGRACTGTVRVLSAPSLPWTTWAKWCRVRDFHPQPLRSERSASCSWANAAKWYSRQGSHLQPDGSKPPALIV